MGDRNVESFRFEATVSGAVRRYRAMFLAVVLATAALAVGLTLNQAEAFRAQATLTAPPPVSSPDQGSDQYLDSQVQLLESPEVAERAADVANRSLGRNVLTPRDFKGEATSLEIIPPVASTPGTYGANTITVAFTWLDAKVAQVGVNSVLKAFDEVRSETIEAQGEATVAGIERTMRDARTRDQLSDLVNQRTNALVNQEMDLARHPTVAWATKPHMAINGNVKRNGVLGLLVGTVLGAALAFARASRRRSFDDQFQPAALYGAPLLGELPSSATRPAASGAPGQLVMTAAARSAAAESFRFAAGAVQRIRSERGKRLSLAFVSAMADPARSAVVANLALALAESGTRVLVVDADASGGDLTAWLLPDNPDADGFEQVLAARRAPFDCVEHSPLQEKVAVLPAGRITGEMVTGAAFLTAVKDVLGKGKAGYEVVLIDSPALLQVAVATELVDASDAVVVVMGPHEPIRDHRDVLGRLELVEANVVGYLYRRATTRPRVARARRLLSRSSAQLARARSRLVRPAWSTFGQGRGSAAKGSGSPSPVAGTRR